jgi:dihydroorotate dehydrogenase electron transfer subunit
MTRAVLEVGRVLGRARAGAYRSLTLVAPRIARTVQPGQFVEVRVGGEGCFLLRRPFSVHLADRGHPGIGTIDIVFEVIGPGTSLLATAGIHDRVDLLGPLGRPFTIPTEPRPCLLVGGGYGTAPLLFLASELRARRCRVDMVVGAASAGRLLKVMDAKRVSSSLTVTTDDGSAGTRGVVTDVLPRLMARARTRTVYACGPMPMLAAVSRVAGQAGVGCEVAVEELMACGTGICFSCVVPVHPDPPAAGTARMARTCLEGPVFDGAAVAWRELGYPDGGPAGGPVTEPPAEELLP